VFNVNIRTATAKDVAALASLACELGYPTTADEMSVRLAPLLNDADHAILMSVDDDVLGWIHVCVVPSLETTPFAEIRGLVVTAAHRSRGIGARLVEAAEAWARDRALPRIRVRSNILRERTHAFYERLGYETTKAQKVFDKSL